MRAPVWVLLFAMALAGCDAPPQSAYVVLQDTKSGTVPVGNNAVGEACRRLDLGGGAADIYCGEWDHPSARVRPGGAATGTDVVRLANGEGSGAAWRSDIDARFACHEPRPTRVLGNAPAALLECQSRNGGFPQMALVVAAGGKVWYADTIVAAFEVTQRSIGALAGVQADAVGLGTAEPDPQLAQRLAASKFGAGDIQAYHTLMREAADANRQGNTSAAEKLYRSVIALQDKLPKVDGAENPDKATAVMSLALQLSNQGRFAEADSNFVHAEALVGPDGGDPTVPPAGSDQTARARLYQYRALHLLNRNQPADALKLLDQAEKAYRVLADPALNRPAGSGGLALDNAVVEAVFGVVDVKRNRAWTLRQLGRLPESDAEAAAAEDLAAAKLPATVSHWRERETAYVHRTRGLTLAQQGQPGDAIGSFNSADRDFTLVYRSTRPQAENKLREAAELLVANQPSEALDRCREAVEILNRRKDGVDSALMGPCLDAYAANATGADAQMRLAEMFESAQQVRSSQTNQQIQQAARRMSENGRDPKAADLIRRRDDADKKLEALQQRRLQAVQPDAGTPPADAATLAKLDAEIAAAAKEADALEETLQAASPSYNQLVPKVVSAREVMAALRPGEAFVDTVLSEKSGWTFVLRDGTITIGHIDGGRARAEKLVQKIRRTLEPDDSGRIRGFDMAASYELYTMVLGPVAGSLHGATTLTISPAGPLLSLPFEVLLTEQVKGHNYGAAPWLVKQFAIAHVPEPGNFLALRRLAGTSKATEPWFGFGAADNVSLAQARASFPPGSCGEAAEELAGLPKLNDAVTELDAARAILGAAPKDQLTGAAFTVAAVEQVPLKRFRILHFAAHGLLPTDLACQSEPAIVTSAPAGAPDAKGALLSASRVERLDLDAELIILSACNSGGSGGSSSGESLSGLARSFFAANARALMVSHWALSSAAATALVPSTLAELRKTPDAGIAGALRTAQLAWLSTFAGQNNSHPHFWGALAVFGEGGGSAAKPQAAVAPPPSHQG